MSAVDDYSATIVIPVFSIGDCVSVNLDHPLAYRHIRGIIGIPVGVVVDHRVQTFGLIKITEISQCLVEWEDAGVGHEKSWVDCSQLLPVEHVAEKLRAVLSHLVDHPRTGDIDIQQG